MEPDTESKAAKAEHNYYLIIIITIYYFFSRPAKPKDQSSMQHTARLKDFEKVSRRLWSGHLGPLISVPEEGG